MKSSERPVVVRGLSVVLLIVAALFLAGPASAQRYLPSLRFRVLTTTHFVVYFHQGEETLARRLSGIAEETYRTLGARLHTVPGGHTHIVLVDQNDTANGWATPLPYNTIEISAIWPAADESIGNTDDWLRLVFTHEYTHILQLDKSRGFASAVRHVLGRSPLAFPNLYLPQWQIEGLATFEESAVTGQGRVPAGSFRIIVDEGVRRGRPEPLDRANGGLDDWPAGTSAYAYGAYFHEYLAERFGEEKLGALLAESSGRFYYLQSPAFKRVFGRSLGSLWKDFEQSRSQRSASDVGAGTPPPARLTFHGFVVSAPRFVRPGKETGSGGTATPRILYSLSNADDFPALMSVEADGTGERRLGSRYFGNGLGIANGLAWFDQLDVKSNVALRSDIYSQDLQTGRVTRLTHDGRFLDPDVSPDGRAVVCVVVQASNRSLAILDVAPGSRAMTLRKVIAGDGTEFASPRWSPDGRFIVAARAGQSRPWEIVLVDAGTGKVSTLVSSTRARNVTPAWTPDGRTILFASDPDGSAFNLFAIDLVDRSDMPAPGDSFRVTRLQAGATDPDVSPDGRTIVYVGYTPQGYDLFTLPLDRTRWERADPEGPSPTGTRLARELADSPGAAAGPGSPYSPLPTLLPRSWAPVFDMGDEQVKLGAVIGSTDVLGRHAYDASVLWRFERNSDSGSIDAAGRPDWSIAYAYTRWRTALFLSGSESTSLFAIPATLRNSDPLRAIRERDWLAGVQVPFVTVRHSQAFEAALSDQRWLLTTRANYQALEKRNAVRLAWSFNNAKIYGYSISPEQGVSLGVASEHVRRGLGADGNADAATVQVRSYLRLGGRHAVLASRVGLGVASGDPAVRRVFYLGGNGPASGLVDFGSDALSLLRGFGTKVFQGRRVANVGVEYRVPVLRVERGHGTWPFFARTLYAAAFLDAGNAWDGPFAASRIKRSYGAELSLDLVLGYSLPLTCSAGIAFPQDPSGPRTRPAAYFRLGRSF
jgi:hypothetical protein